MKKLNITKEQFNRSNYFQRKYGKLEYVSESGKLFKTSKGKVLKFNEGFMSNIGKDGQRLYSIVYSADGWDGSIQEYGKSEEDAIQAAIAKGKLDGDEDIVKIVDLGERGKYLESSKKLVKEGAGAGYTVEIKGLKFGKIVDYKFEKGEDTYKVKVEVVPGVYEIAAQDYYNDFFWQEHDFDETPDAQIDGGYAIFDIALDGNPDEDDEALFQMSRELQNRKLDISFDYGWGWTHVNLPREEIELDERVDIDEREVYFGIDKLVLNAPDLADAVNNGFQSTFDQGEEDSEKDEDGEPVINEVSGWKLEDEDLTLVNSKSDGDKLYIVKLWWGSGYQMDCYNAYAFNEEEALNYVVAYIEKEDPGILERSDEAAATLRTELADENELENSLEAEDLPEFQETFMCVDATTEGASDTHYIWAENLVIAEYPKEHDYPMSKGARRVNESYDPKGDDGRKRVMDALEEFRQVLWDDTKVDDEEEHDLRRSLYQDVDNAISQAIQKYFKYSRM